jgi:hypothetical protein
MFEDAGHLRQQLAGAFMQRDEEIGASFLRNFGPSAANKSNLLVGT